MKKVLPLLIVLLLGFVAESTAQDKVIWRKNVNRHGVYTTPVRYISDYGWGMSLGLNYFYGDAERQGDFQVSPNNIGGHLRVFYTKPLGCPYVELRAQVGLNYLRGNSGTTIAYTTASIMNGAKGYDYRNFWGIAIEPAVLFDFYPIKNVGFYIQVGAGVDLEIARLDYYKGNRELGLLATNYTGTDFLISPVIIAGLGYRWRVKDNWRFGVELTVHQTFMDESTFNLDGWPHGINHGVIMGPDPKDMESWGHSKANNDLDGYFNLNFTVQYRFRKKCNVCRSLDW